MHIDWGLAVSAGALGVAALMLALTIRRDMAAERERDMARDSERQLTMDRLSNIADISRETRDAVREMSRQLADHGQELARIRAEIAEHDRRLGAVEQRCERRQCGGTD